MFVHLKFLAQEELSISNVLHRQWVIQCDTCTPDVCNDM